MIRLSTLILLASLTPAMAQDQPAPNLATTGQGTQGGVARLILAHQLYTLGIANKDPLTVLNAARLAASVTLTDSQNAHETSGEPAALLPSHPTTVAQMFDAATALAADSDPMLDMIDASRRELPFIAQATAVSSNSTLAPAQTDSWQVPFFGAALAEVAILGTGNGNLALWITDENGNSVCQDKGPTDAAYCSFYPAQNGQFQITVSNIDSAENSYLLLTN